MSRNGAIFESSQKGKRASHLTNTVPRRNFLGKAVPLGGLATVLAYSEEAHPATADVVQGVEKLGCAISDKTFAIHNVKCFGAKGDGVADDTRAIQNAIDAFPNFALDLGGPLLGISGGIVYFPPGNYRVTSPIEISLSGIRLVGTSRTTVTIINQTSSAAVVLIDHVDKGNYIHNGSIEHLRIRCLAGTGVGIRIDAVANWLFDDLTIEGGAGGNRGIDITSPCVDLEFRRVHIENFETGFHLGREAPERSTGGNAIRFTDCYANSNGRGIYTMPIPGGAYVNLSINGGVYEYNDQYGIHLNSVYGGSITGTYFEGNGEADIQLGTLSNGQSLCFATTVSSVTASGTEGHVTKNYLNFIQGRGLTVIGTRINNHLTGIYVSASQEDGKGLVYMGNLMHCVNTPFVGPPPAFNNTQVECV